jgi:hypothetical protein
VRSGRSVVAGLLTALLAAGCSGSPPAHHAANRRSTGPIRRSTSGVLVPRPTTDWRLARTGAPDAIEGFTSRVSVLPGQPFQLYVSTTAHSFRVSAFRMGWYGSTPAALVWRSPPTHGVRQARPAEISATRTPYAPWHPSLTVRTKGWPTGDYLLRLQAASGAQRYVPIVVRSASTAGRVVLLSGVTTFQAYNTWGGWSLYQGPSGSMADRAYAVSFDRPYVGNGDADFIGLELPVVSFASRLRLPLAYETGIDLDEHPGLLAGARAVISLGHDEYYSAAMRTALLTARDHGTNLAFLGANAIYRHIRLARTSIGPDRLEIDYKDFSLDPIHVTDGPAATAQWESPPYPRPESVLTGAMYMCNPVHDRLVVADPSSWLLSGLGLHRGERLGALVGPEYDEVNRSFPTPRPMDILFHSPLVCGGSPGFSDVVYYTTRSGAGVFDSGTSKWECALNNVACGAGWGDPMTYRVVRAITARLLTAFAAGPAGKAHPAVDDLARLHV